MSFRLIYPQQIFWGKFIERAFSMYSSGVMNPPQPPDFPTGWKLLKNITAEAVVGFFRQKQLIGFVAESLEQPNKFAVVLHGSEGVADFLDDFEFLLTDFDLVQNGGRTEYGFTRFYESFLFVDSNTGTSQSLQDYLEQLSNLQPCPSFTVTGHSLGGALATLHAVVLASRGIPVDAYIFASPMVGDSTFGQTYKSLVPNSYLVVNKPDIVPQLPGTLLGYEHVNTLFEINSLNFLEIKHGISCYHHLSTYLYALGAIDTALGSCKA